MALARLRRDVQPMSSPVEGVPQPAGPKVQKPAPPARRPWSPWLYAGVLLIVVVGGIAFSLSVQALTTNCADTPSNPALFSVPSCGNLLVTSVVSAVVGGIAVGLGALLLRQADVRPWRRVPLAAGIFVALLIVVAGVPLALTPPLGNIGIPPELPFPIPAGTTFNASMGEFDAYVQAQIPTDPYAPYAPIYLEGAYNATSTVCLYIARSAGPDLGPGAHSVCGASVSFAFGVTASTWMIAFYVPTENPQTVFSATVVITQPVQIAY